MPEYKKIILYHANWCPHCINFLPTWKKLKSELKQIGSGIQCEDYEQTANEQLCDERGIKGYPTIHLEKEGGKIEEYEGSRELKDIIDYLTGSSGSSGTLKQCGGGKRKVPEYRGPYYYKRKALKYKAKYMLECAKENGELSE